MVTGYTPIAGFGEIIPASDRPLTGRGEEKKVEPVHNLDWETPFTDHNVLTGGPSWTPEHQRLLPT